LNRQGQAGQFSTEGEPDAMSGVSSAKLGTIQRSDGATQVTYAGWPLYTFVEDHKAGEDNGTDSKASWYPLHPNGQKAGH
jgi:predicted lipoprotein with Yx(FWY)xxD motif